MRLFSLIFNTVNSEKKVFLFSALCYPKISFPFPLGATVRCLADLQDFDFEACLDSSKQRNSDLSPKCCYGLQKGRM